jgi:NAD(P)-dependent dehydrogenase (short-subunit alcohol dehydrogenase family)
MEEISVAACRMPNILNGELKGNLPAGGTLKGKKCVITGATSGIGRAASIQLGELGADLILTGRDERKGAELVRRLQRDSACGTARFMRADLSVQREVRELAAAIRNRCARVDILINNAGARFDTFRLSPDNIELTFATNHLSHFLLTLLLLDTLRAAEAARVITVASGAHSNARGDFERYVRAENYDRKAAYGNSKLANLMFAYELARRLKGAKITSNAVDPGGVATNFGRNNGFKSWMRHIGYHALKRELLSPRKGAETIVFLASSPAVEGVSGKYFFQKREIESSGISQDEAAAKRLWESSLDMTGLDDPMGPDWALVIPSSTKSVC